MGCEVQKLANHFIHNPFAFNSDNNLDNYKLLAQRIKIPVLMFNNQFDNIVDSKINKSFFDSIMSHKQYVTINQFNTQPHGVFTYLSHELMEIESLFFLKDIFSDLLIDLKIKNRFYLYYGLNFEFSNYVNKKGNEIINYEQISYLFLNSGNTIEKYICRFNLDQKQCAEFKKHYLILKEFHLQNYHNNQFNEISEKSKYHLQRPNFESVQPSIEFMWNLTKAIF